MQYYFRKSDKNDLKGIIEDCEEQFRLGASQGKTEEEICCKLGHPKNIYRYYIGEPVVPEDNPRMPGDDYDDAYQEYDDFGRGPRRPAMICRNSPSMIIAAPAKGVGPTNPVRPSTGPTENRTGKQARILIGMTGPTTQPKPLPVLF